MKHPSLFKKQGLLEKIASLLVLLCITQFSFSQIVTVIDQYGATIIIDTGKKPTDATAARSIQATIGLALPAAAQNVSDLKKAQNANDEKIKELSTEAKIHQGQQDNLKTGWVTYSRNLQPYNEDLDRYTTDNDAYKRELTPYENTPPEKKSQSTYNYLKSWRDKLVGWKARLDNEKGPLTDEYNGLKNRQSALGNDADRLLWESSQLQMKTDDIKAKLGLAYQQLQRLVTYSGEIKTILDNNKSWQVTPTPGEMLNNANEKLKEKSNMGFDGNKELDWLREIIKPFVATANQ